MNSLPIVYSCSGCSNVAQIANFMALKSDRMGIAEMSCIAGVGGDVAKLVRVARSGRKIIVIDGCPLRCSRHCLSKKNVLPDFHFIVSDHGIKKKAREPFEQEDAEYIYSIYEKVLISTGLLT